MCDPTAERRRHLVSEPLLEKIVDLVEPELIERELHDRLRHFDEEPLGGVAHVAHLRRANNRNLERFVELFEQHPRGFVEQVDVVDEHHNRPLGYQLFH